MSEVMINGISVKFPFKPYKVQENYMEKVLECLQNGYHGVLESPTGTGKTLSLLCSSLSWQVIKKAQMQAACVLQPTDGSSQMVKDLKNQLDKGGGLLMQTAAYAPPRIIYASRTHSQLSQAMQELKRTDYKHVQATVLGSRDQMCIHPEVSKEQNSANKIHMCQAKIRSRTCYFYNNVENAKNYPAFQNEILDIEDLVKQGTKQKCCPYFLTKELKQNADIVFMPYNYLLDPRSRKSQGIDLHNNVILLDEAHNVEKTCEEAASLEISSTDIAVCVEEITSVMNDVSKEMSQEESNFTTEGANVQKDFTPEDLITLKTMFLAIEKAIDEIEVKNRTEGETKPGGFIFDLLKQAQLNYDNYKFVADILDKIILYLTTTSTSPFSRKGNALQKFNDLLRIVFVEGVQNYNKVKDCYKVHIEFEDQKKSFGKSDGWEAKKPSKTNEGKVINYWCFSPGFGMQQLVSMGVRSIILTSGTLSPLKPFISEIGIKVNVTLENPHIVEQNQVCVGVLSKGPDGHLLNSSYNTRNDPLYIKSLGCVLLNFSNLVPHGLLVFFPSYPILNKCRDDWQTAGLWNKIAEKKPIFVEPKSKANLPSIMNEFYEKIQNPEFRGAIFLAVCRGKVSEGLDFADNNGRAVLITGLPFPPLKDPRVILKKRYLDENYAKDKNGITGQYWYQLEAMRAVNQAIGRIIRHKNDYGAIILCDCRFESMSNKNQLSSWIRPSIKHFTDFGMVTKELRNFFVFLRKLYPEFDASVVKKSNPGSATVDRSSSRKILRSQISNSERNSFQQTDEDILKCYNANGSTSESNSSGEKTQSTNLREALKMSKATVFNFNSCLTSQKKPREPEKSADEIMQVRKKAKLARVPFTLDSPQPSCSGVNNIQKKSELSDKEKKEAGAKYINEVKAFLSQQEFGIFRKMIVEYSKTRNFENLIETIDNLFRKSTDKLHFYIGFKNYIQKPHKELFDSHISQLTFN